MSLETALSYYSIIPEVTTEVTSVTVRQTKVFRNVFGIFRYFSCKKEVFCGYYLLSMDRYKVQIAEKEKAIVDYVYFKLRRGENINVEDERLDMEYLRKMDWKKIKKYSMLFNMFVEYKMEDIRRVVK